MVELRHTDGEKADVCHLVLVGGEPVHEAAQGTGLPHTRLAVNVRRQFISERSAC